ncbi:MAG: aspartate--ammonia ligase [Clostridia bacterium]|nr:aspartate--ammonia ligase [Clostridia bacterium]MBR2875195.1 aspartate--ammonia ligase [Clostridia bacterium]
MKHVIFDTHYKNPLNIRETEKAIKFIKDTFERKFAKALNLERISAPLFVRSDSGLNDNLSGVERAVSFDIKHIDGIKAEIVHSLAKWKRMALYRYHFANGEGLYTDMNAIRRDEEVDNLHSLYVDQWDWEKVIEDKDRNVDYLKAVVKDIVGAIADTQDAVKELYPFVQNEIKRDVFFITTQELEDMYPDIDSSAREYQIAKEHGTVFLMQIGDVLKSGKKHDNRAPDYDDWSLNGDIIVYNKILDCSFELSSMGIRVNKEVMLKQLQKANAMDRLELPFHKGILNDRFPLSVGGGIGQSRLCMFMLDKLHVGEVQASIWPQDMVEDFKSINSRLL